MRKIVLDTETTGIDHKQGHRLVELAAIVLDGRKVSTEQFHVYLNPERDIDEGAAAVHGLTTERLKDEPKFADIAADFLAFIDGAELIIHNAPFDIGFLNAELARMKLPALQNTVTDTLKTARELHPGKKNNLDALCSRYEIDNSHRTLHGALLDCELLAEVYFAFTRGQHSLLGEEVAPVRTLAVLNTTSSRAVVRIIHADESELAAHQQQIADIDKASKGACVWKLLQEAA
ncbi:MAG: DNA polymerase III subunit epsilon [Gallionella sp.]